jgi:hypothetical protein
MKSTAWKKDFLVILHSDYDDTWLLRTIPLTLKQAVKFVYAKRWDVAMNAGRVRIVTLAEYEALPNREVRA